MSKKQLNPKPTNQPTVAMLAKHSNYLICCPD